MFDDVTGMNEICTMYSQMFSRL